MIEDTEGIQSPPLCTELIIDSLTCTSAAKMQHMQYLLDDN